MRLFLLDYTFHLWLSNAVTMIPSAYSLDTNLMIAARKCSVHTAALSPSESYHITIIVLTDHYNDNDTAG